MLYKDVYLEDHFAGLPKLLKKSRLTLFMADQIGEIEQELGRKRPARTVLILPGGGYHFTADREAEPIALKFLAEGINAAVLYYNCAPEGALYPDHLLAAAAAMAYLRQNADELEIDKNHIAVMGFSAGGHLAASLGTLWKEPVIEERLGIAPELARPDGMILCYAVISVKKLIAHRGSFENLLGKNPDESLIEKVSLETGVQPDTPPAFIWHTVDDELVPVENALLMAGALQQKGVSYELHIYPSGAHGLALCNEVTGLAGVQKRINPYVEGWFDHAVSWVREFM